jgi:hypothetical protein
MPPPPPLPVNFLDRTELGRKVEGLLAVSITADRARATRAKLIEAWQLRATNADINRRTRLRRQFERRTATGFRAPDAGNAGALKRGSRGVLRQQYQLIVEAHNRTAAMPEAEASVQFLGAMKLAAANFPWAADARALFRTVCAGAWKSSTGTWEMGACVNGTQRHALFSMATAKHAAAVDATDMTHDANVCLEILDGMGTTGDKLKALQALELDFEIEDSFAATTTKQGAKIWHPASHKFFAEEVTPEAVRRLREELRFKAKTAPYWEPELIMGSPELLDEDQMWESVFLQQTDANVHDNEVRRAAHFIVASTLMISADELRALRGSLRGTQFQELSNNSSWCRALFGQQQSTYDLEFPDFEEYEMVEVIGSAANTQAESVQEVGITTLVKNAILGAGRAVDRYPERVSVQDMRILSGAENTSQCEGGVMTTSGGEVVFKAAWCRGTRALLNGDRTVAVKGMAMTFALRLPREQQLPLNRNTTSLFLMLCKERGLSEEEATVALTNALTKQLRGVAGVVLVKCRYPQGGGRPDLFWDWWSSSVEVRLLFATVEELRQALVDVSTAEVEIWLHDGETRETSVLALRAWVVQNRGIPSIDAAADTDVIFAGVHAETRAHNCYHLLITGFNRATFMGLKMLAGIAANDPDKLVVIFQAKFAGLDSLHDEGVELVREEAMRHQKTKGNHRAAKGRTIGGRGPRAWNLDGGMRVFPTSVESGKLYQLALWKGEDADGTEFLVMPNHAGGTLTVTVKNPKGKMWEGKRDAKGRVEELDHEAFALLNINDIVAHIDAKLHECLRVTLPKPGQTLEEQPMHQRHAWPTLRNVLQQGVPEEYSWIEIVDHYEATYAVDRVDLFPYTGDNRLLELYDAPGRLDEDEIERGDEEEEPAAAEREEGEQEEVAERAEAGGEEAPRERRRAPQEGEEGGGRVAARGRRRAQQGEEEEEAPVEARGRRRAQREAANEEREQGEDEEMGEEGLDPQLPGLDLEQGQGMDRQDMERRHGQEVAEMTETQQEQATLMQQTVERERMDIPYGDLEAWEQGKREEMVDLEEVQGGERHNMELNHAREWEFMLETQRAERGEEGDGSLEGGPMSQ